jgi:hypothetical protein
MATVDARILLGWMGRDEAVALLQKECVFDPALSENQATELWATYKARVDHLPERILEQPKRWPIPAQHRALVADFKARTRGPEILDVVNIDPLGLVAYQNYVVIDRATDHHCHQRDAWAKKTLLLDRPPANLAVRAENGTVKVAVPHAEHMFELHPDGAFRIVQGGGFVSVVELEGRLILRAGYHRSFAFALAAKNEPEAKDKCVLVALTRTVPAELLPGWVPQPGLRTTVLGPRPPLFSDFFDDDFAMIVKLRKKRYEMHIRAESHAFDV